MAGLLAASAAVILVTEGADLGLCALFGLILSPDAIGNIRCTVHDGARNSESRNQH